MVECFLDDGRFIPDGFLHGEIHLVVITRYKGLTRLGIRDGEDQFSRIPAGQDDTAFTAIETLCSWQNPRGSG